MPRYDIRMRVTYEETWSVEAADEADARRLAEDCDDSVDTEEFGGEVVDWEVTSLKVAAE